MNDYMPGDTPRTPRDPGEAEVRADVRAALWKRTAAGAAVLGLLLGLSGVGYTVYVIRQTQVSNRPVLRDTHAAADAAVRSAADAAATADRIADCTTPGRECYERAQAQTGTAVSGINTVTIRATACLISFLDSTPHNVALTVDQIAARMKSCIQSGHVTVIPQGAASDLIPTPATSTPTPRRTPTPTRTPSPSPSPTPTPRGPKPPPFCLLDVCLPMPLALGHGRHH